MIAITFLKIKEVERNIFVMETNLSDITCLEQILKYLEIQNHNQEQFNRIVDSSYELVDYLPDSFTRFWINDVPLNYTTHWHPAIEIIIPLRNTYNVIIRNQKYELQPGDIFIIPAGELHHLISPKSGLRLIYLFNFNILSKIKGFSYLSSVLSQPITINKENYGPIYDKELELILQMCDSYFENGRFKELNIYASILSFLVTLGTYQMNIDESTSHNNLSINTQKSLMERLNKAIDYLDEYYMEDVSLEAVAKVAGFSKFHFSRLFKQYSGYTFYDYLCFRRIKSAVNLLLNPDLSVTEIALQSGFASLSTFNRTFKRLKDCTPSEYRKLYNPSGHQP